MYRTGLLICIGLYLASSKNLKEEEVELLFFPKITSEFP